MQRGAVGSHPVQALDCQPAPSRRCPPHPGLFTHAVNAHDIRLMISSKAYDLYLTRSQPDQLQLMLENIDGA
eukprot:1161559-Pelagomonas_calceolata.AAC.1